MSVDSGTFDAGPPPEPLDCDDPELWDEPVVGSIEGAYDQGCVDQPPIAVRWMYPNSYPDDPSEWLPRGACWRVTDAPPGSGWEVGDVVFGESQLHVRLLAQESRDAVTVFEGRCATPTAGSAPSRPSR